MHREHPPYAIAAVGAVLIKDGEILLVKRGASPGKGLWSIPGGVVEVGEDVFEAAKRELLEETGLEATPIGVIGVLTLIVRDATSKVRYHYVIVDVMFDEKAVKGVPRPGGDAVDVAFISIDKALVRDDITKTTKMLIQNLVQRGIASVPVYTVVINE